MYGYIFKNKPTNVYILYGLKQLPLKNIFFQHILTCDTIITDFKCPILSYWNLFWNISHFPPCFVFFRVKPFWNSPRKIRKGQRGKTLPENSAHSRSAISRCQLIYQSQCSQGRTILKTRPLGIKRQWTIPIHWVINTAHSTQDHRGIDSGSGCSCHRHIFLPILLLFSEPTQVNSSDFY